MLNQLTRILTHRGLDAENCWKQGSVALACRVGLTAPEAGAEVQPFVHPTGSVLVFDGRLDNREELLAVLKGVPGVSFDSPDPAFVLAAYEAFGDRFPEKLAGDFALALFDPRRQQLLLARDAIGVRPLYYSRCGDTFTFASEIKALLAHPQFSAKPNEDLLASYLVGEFPHDTQGQTFFDGVFSVPPAHTAILTTQGLVVRRYWDFDTARKIQLGSFADYAEAFRHLLEQSVRRRLRSADPVAFLVSGGLDSSSLFCLAHTLRRREPNRFPALLGVSYSPRDGSPADESRFLAEVERLYDIDIKYSLVGAGDVMPGARQQVWHHELPFLDGLWDAWSRSISVARQLGARVLVTGIWGDQVVFPQAYLVDLFRHLKWGAVKQHLEEFPLWLGKDEANVLRQEFLRNAAKSCLPEAAVKWIRRLRSRPDCDWYSYAIRRRTRPQSQARHSRIAFASEHARSLYSEVRSSYAQMHLERLNKMAAMQGMDINFPFLDRDLVSFLIGIPGEMQAWGGVPKAILREAMRGVLPELIAHRSWQADYSILVRDGMTHDYPEFVRLFSSQVIAAGFDYVNTDTIMKELRRLQEPGKDFTSNFVRDLPKLAALETWLRVFRIQPGKGVMDPIAARR